MPLAQLVVEVEAPNEKLQGSFSFERRKGANPVWEGFMRRLSKEMKRP